MYFFFSQVLNFRKHLNSLFCVEGRLPSGLPAPFFGLPSGSPPPSLVNLDPRWCPVSLTPMLVSTISSAKCDALVFLSDSNNAQKTHVLHVSCCFLHTFVYITFTSLFSIVCAKTDWFKGFQRSCFKLLWGWFFFPRLFLFLMRQISPRLPVRVLACALGLSSDLACRPQR